MKKNIRKSTISFTSFRKPDIYKIALKFDHSLPVILILLLLFLPLLTYALRNDNQQIATIQADSATYYHKTGAGEYLGHVHIKQGTTQLSANKVFTYTNKKQQVTKAIAIGRPAHYQTLFKKGGRIFHASANKIEYHANKKTVVLIGNAVVKQGLNVIRSPVIIYNMQKGIVQTKSTKKERTTIIFTTNSLAHIQAPTQQRGKKH